MRSGTPLARLRERQRRAVAPERLAYARERGLEYAVEQTEIVAGAAAVDAAAAQADVAGLADGTTPHTGLNVGGVDVKPFLDKTDGTKLVQATGLGAAVVETEAVLQGDITPYYTAITSTAVLWTAESTQKEVQTLAVTVVRGGVLIDGLINTLFTGIGSAATVGTLSLFRNGVELTTAAVQLSYAGSVGGTYVLPRQYVLRYVDTPGAGSFTYSLEFSPGEVTDGQVFRRSLTVTPLEG